MSDKQITFRCEICKKNITLNHQNKVIYNARPHYNGDACSSCHYNIIIPKVMRNKGYNEKFIKDYLDTINCV